MTTDRREAEARDILLAVRNGALTPERARQLIARHRRWGRVLVTASFVAGVLAGATWCVLWKIEKEAPGIEGKPQ